MPQIEMKSGYILLILLVVNIANTCGQSHSSEEASTESPIEPNCADKCRVEINGEIWAACPGHSDQKECLKGRDAMVTWNCLPHGKFEGSEPNSTECDHLAIQLLDEAKQVLLEPQLTTGEPELKPGKPELQPGQPELTTRQPELTRITTEELVIFGETEDITPNCNPPCSSQIDGIDWKGCPGDSVQKACVESGAEAAGKMTWFCQPNGTFEGHRPNSSACESKWIRIVQEDYREQTENGTLEADGAKSLLEKIERGLDNPVEENQRTFYGHEIKEIASTVQQIAQGTHTEKNADILTIINQTVAISGSVLGHADSWNDLNQGRERADVGQALLIALEETVLSLSMLAFTDKSEHSFQSSRLKEDFLVNIGSSDSNKSGVPLVFPPNSTDPSARSFLTMDEKWQDLVETPSYVAYSVKSDFYKDIFSANLNNFTDNSPEKGIEKIVNSNLLSLRLNGLQNRSLQGQRIRLSFKHDHVAVEGDIPLLFRSCHPHEPPKLALNTATCAYWSNEKRLWLTDGCALIQKTPEYTECECNHLTSFTVLMDLHQCLGKNFSLEILTYVLSSLSVLCLLATIAILQLVRGIQNERTTITKHLCVNLLLGHILMLFLVDRNYIDVGMGGCIGVGVVTHYIFLVAFFWMAVEGFHLYHKVVNVFQFASSPMRFYYLAAYGIPLLIVGLTCAVGYGAGDRPYGGEMFCWLGGHYVAFFGVPIGIIVVGNVLVLSIALRKVSQVNRAPTCSAKAETRSNRKALHGYLFLSVLLGLTWIPGFGLMFDSYMAVMIFGYVFVILNASQGIFLLVFTWLTNESVRQAIGKRIPALSPPSRTTEDSLFCPGCRQTYVGSKSHSCVNSRAELSETQDRPKARKYSQSATASTGISRSKDV